MTIPMVNLTRQYQRLASEIEPLLLEVARSSHYVLGPQLQAFEADISHYLDTPHAIGVGSGSDALTIALNALQLGAGDEVITTGFTFVGTAEAIVHSGATPVFVDIERDTYNIDPQRVLEAITPRTRAVIAVHLYGQSAELDALAALCRDHDLALVEDCAQALGAEYHGQRAGTHGIIGCFSFYPSKNLGAFGDGGLLCTADDTLAERIRQLRNHGSRQHYDHVQTGYTSRLDELQAAVLRVKLQRLDHWNRQRAALAEHYRYRLAGSGLRLPKTAPGRTHVYQQYTIATAQRDRLKDRLAQQGIASAIHYARPLHRQPVFAPRHGHQSLPVAEQAAAEVLCLPLCPALQLDEVDRICDVLLQAITEKEADHGHVRTA